jgi:hypothetical protein
VIFREATLRGGDYRAIFAETEHRAAGCGQNADGTFAPKNQCQEDGAGGGLPPAARDNSWKTSDSEVTFSGGSKIESLAIAQPKAVAATMKRLGVDDLDSIVAIGGGAVRGSRISVGDMDDEAITVSLTSPVDPSDPSSPNATTSVMLMEGFGEGETVVDYSDFHPGGTLGDAKAQEGGENNAKRLRLASILKERMLESLLAADKAGISKAATMAVGRKGDPYVKGYRLWPTFGFDAKVPKSLMAKIPDEILLKATGVDIPSQGTGRIPREVVIKNLRQQVKSVTIQQLMQFRAGENWWTDNGSSIEMSLDLKDKNSLGYKKFQEELKKLPALKKRNEGRSWYPIDDFERRSCDGSDKDETGRFAAGNDCGGQGQSGGSSPRPPSRAKREQWRKSEDDVVFLDSKSLKEGSPVIGGERLHELAIERPKNVAAALDAVGVKDLDTAVKIGGGAIRGADVRVRNFGPETVSIFISSPIDPDDEDVGSVITSVDLTKYDDGLEVSYGGLNTPKGVSDPSRLDAGARDKTRLRIASLMQERMIESLMSAQKAGAVRASTYAAGDSDDPYYQGYRLWPQFGFDAKLDLTQYQVPPEIVLASFKKKAPESASEAAKQAKKLTSKGFTLQQLISTREGKKWWDDNGSSVDMTIDLKDRKSLGYKKLARLKKLLPKLKERNVAEGRTLLGWLIEEVSRRSMSVMGFFGGLSRAIEQRDCGPSDKKADGTFAPGNDCQEGAGGGDSPKSGGEKPRSVIWTPGQSAGLVTSKARENPPTTRSDDGKRIASTSIPDAHVYEGRGGREFVGTVDVGGALASEQDAIRGEKIDTGKKVLDGAESEYILAALEEQVREATGRGIEPKFYSPEEREEQLAAFAGMIPEVRGGRTKSGAMIEQEDAEHLFRVLQAITSPNASPFINMQRTDSLLQKFFYGDGLVTTSDSLGVTGAGIKKSLRRFQKIVDTLGKRTDGSIDTAAGLRAARELLQGRSLRAGDIEKFFADFASPGEKKGTWKPGSYLVDEVVPVFSTFGPKVGPFYGNNNGDLDPLTADVWFSRTWGRVTGELVIPGSPTKSAKQATELAKVIGKASDDQLHGISGAALADAVKQTSETGAVSDVLRAWAGARLRHYARGDYKEKTGTGGKLNRLAKNIVENDTALIGDPGSGSRRSHMIRLMREVSRKTGTPVAYLQDILWQDEQDAYGALGAMTATNVGEPSLYSDQIRKLAANDGKSRKQRAKADRGYRRNYEQPEPFVDDYERGGREQMLWDAALAHLSDEEFAEAVIKLAEKARPTEEHREERRNFAALDYGVEIRSADCGRDEGGKFGPKNQCQEDGGQSDRTTPHGKWSISAEPKEPSSQNRLATTHVVRLTGDDGKVKAYIDVEMGYDKETLYVDFGSVAEPYRGQGVYKSLLESLQNEYTIVSDEVHNVATPVRKAYEELGAFVNRYDQYELKKKKKGESRSADCGRQDGGMFGDGNTCAKGDEGLSNSKGESFRGVRRKSDKTQTKVARKLYQMRVPEKNLKGLVRNLGGKVSNTLVEIDSTRGDEGVNVFVRDRDNNETHYIHIGYYGATIYTTETAPASEVSRIQAAAKDSLPKTIDNRLWGGGSDYPVYVVNSPDETSKTWDGLSAKQRLKKERRSADCGRTDDGKFGPKNDCQEGAGQGGDGKPSLLATNENKSWSPADGAEPFDGASRYSSVSTSGGAKVAESLDKMGVRPSDAIAATGAPERAEVIMRPATEFSAFEEFAGGEAKPIFMDFTADVAGVRRGLSGSSVLGSRKNEATGEQEKVLFHNVFEVLPAVEKDPAKRHAAARAFYRTMVSSIESARKSGIAEITFSAAGAADYKGGFRGYTIWPRMGFDAKLPDRIRSKLPETLAHATSLLDLHATREGTKWWADNGEDVDVSMPLGDRSSPQSKIVDRFIKHFMKERREMPLGTGDGWLSPEDLLRLDEMWQEVWDEGDLDDYEYVESRSADCGRTDDGKFGPKNECQEEGSGGTDKKGPRSSAKKGLSPKAEQIKQLAAKGASRKQLQAAIEKAIVGKSGWLGGYTPGEASPSEVCRALGIKVANEDALDELIANSWDYERRGIAAAIAQLSSAQQADPEGLKNSVIRIDTAKSAAKWLGVGKSDFSGTLGAYIGPLDTISIIAGNEDDADHLKRLYDAGYDSTPHPAHTVIHENAHRSHYQEIERQSGIKRPARGTGPREWKEYQAKVDDLVYGRISKEYHGDYDYALRVSKKISDISWYGTVDPFEAIAEYSTAVRLGYAKNDKDLDRLCRVALAPVPRRISR